MSKRRMAKKPPPYFYDGPPVDHVSHKDSPVETLDETEDIYDTHQRESMLQEDNISSTEEGFMIGREQEPPDKKATRKNAISHDDQIATELAKEDAEDS